MHSGIQRDPGDLLAATGVHSDLSDFLFADGHVKALHGMAVSVGWNNSAAADGTNYQGLGGNSGVQEKSYAANTQCGDAALARTFSVN